MVENEDMQKNSLNQDLAIDATPLIQWGWLRAFLFFIAWFVLYFIINGVSLIALAILYDINLSDALRDSSAFVETIGVYPYLIISVFGFIGLLLVVWIFRRMIDKRSIVSLGFFWKGHQLHFSAGMIWGFVLISTGFVMLNRLELAQVSGITPDLSALAGYLLVFCVAALNEEILIRGYILNNLMESMNKYAALTVSSLVFAVLHLSNPSAKMSVLPFINLMLAGIILGIYYIHQRNLWFSIGMHLTWNFFEGPVFGFKVSGLKTTSLIDQQLQGSSLLTGGEFGFEGSLLLTGLLIIGILVIHFFYSK